MQAKWEAQIVIVPQKNETNQFYVDYLWFNAISIQDSYPVNCVDKCIN